MDCSDYIINDRRLIKYTGREKQITIPDIIENIEEYAFRATHSLEIIRIPGTVREIGNHAFFGARSLRVVIIEKGTAAIGHHAFFGCPIEDIYIPDSVLEIGASAMITFSDKEPCIHCRKGSVADVYASEMGFGCRYDYPKKEKRVTDSQHLQLQHTWDCVFSQDGKTVYIPDGVTEVSGAFRFNLRIERVVLPESVKAIDKQAFYHCHNLKIINFPSNISSIGEEAFMFCTLDVVSVPKRLRIIQKGTFYACRAKRVTLPQDIVSIEEKAFAGNDFDSVLLPDSLEHIGSSAFSGCQNLKKVIIPESVRNIGNNAFANCRNLREVVFKGNKIELGNDLFALTDNITVRLCKNITSFNPDAFRMARGLIISKSICL